MVTGLCGIAVGKPLDTVLHGQVVNHNSTASQEDGATSRDLTEAREVPRSVSFSGWALVDTGGSWSVATGHLGSTQ